MLGRRTKIVATIGPACDDERVLAATLAAGVDTARISLAHGDLAEARARVAKVRALETTLGHPIGILIDLPGPKMRVKRFPEGGVLLTETHRIELREPGEYESSDDQVIVVEGEGVIGQLSPGDRIALGDGGVTIVVDTVDTSANVATAIVVSGGLLQGRPGLHLPASRIATPTPTADDLVLLAGILDANVDAVAVSFVRSAEDINRARAACAGSEAMIVAKIETQEAVDALDEIVQAADAVMVARGDLGVRCRLEDVPHYQKRIIRTSVFYGRPVITATQMLESMVVSPVPTRAEVTDVANAVFDGSSALMLSGETAIGRDPAAAVRTMATIAARADREFDHQAWSDRLLAEQHARLVGATPTQRITEAMSTAGWRAAIDAGAVAVIACTNTGTTARVIARFRPEVPILAVTPSEATLRKLSLSWGVQAVRDQRHATTDPHDPAPTTDTLRIVRVH
jgi:pyruvate kinase